MTDIAYFVPGNPPSDTKRRSPLQVYLPTMQAGVAAAYIEAMTRPGDLVLDPFCQTTQVICEGLALGRRVLAANFNPVITRAVDLSLTWDDWPDRSAVNTAFTHLADSLKGNDTLRARLATHYATRCPTCKKPAQAGSFVWDRDQGEPVEKRVRCTQCNSTSRGPVDEDDLKLSRRYEPRSLPYWLLLDRVVPPDQDADERERAASVLATYTSRTLTAISDVLFRFDALPEAERATLRPLLLETWAVCSAVHPHTDDERARLTRPRSLKPPARFVEHNVWQVMEEAVSRATSRGSQPGLPRAADVNTLLAQREPAACVVARNSREIAKLAEPGRAALVIGMPPELDTTFWALSAVWGAWLWGERAADALRPLLGRRRADVEWLWRVLASALGALSPTLSETGKLALIHSTADDEWIGGFALAGAGAGLALDCAFAEPHDGLRLSWKRSPAPPERQLDTEALGMEVMEIAEQAALDAIRARGEPATWVQLAAAIYQALGRSDLLRIAAHMPDDDPRLTLLTQFVRGTFQGRETAIQRVAGSDQVWWTNRTIPRMGLPLSDMVEVAVYDTLQETGEHDEAAIVHSVYRRFPGPLTPERALVAMCMDSYAQRVRPGVYTLREKDISGVRQREIEALRGELGALGLRLGWDVDEYANDRIVWSEKRVPVYTFLFSATAQLAPHLLAKRPPAGTPVLVIPGGRSALIEYKLRRNVQFRDAVMGAGWQFLKFRHLRTLAADPSLSRESFQAALGLDPLIETERQMALFPDTDRTDDHK
jgi:hypothetical protein